MGAALWNEALPLGGAVLAAIPANEFLSRPAGHFRPQRFVVFRQSQG